MKHGRYYSVLRSFCFILSFVTFLSMFPCLNVKASSFPDIWDMYGVTKEELLEMKNESGFIVIDSSHLYTNDYVKEESIKLTNNEFTAIWKFDGLNYTIDDTSTVGQTMVSDHVEYLYLTLYNGGSLLFNSPGSLTLELFAYANDIDLIAYHSAGGTTTYSVPINYQSYDATSLITINNFDGDIVKIEIKYNLPINQSDGTKWIGGGIYDYGYELGTGEIIGSEHSKNIFELLQSFFAYFWNNVATSIGNIFTFLKTFISNFWTSLASSLGNGYDYLTEKVSNLFQYLKEFVLGFWNSLSVSLESALDYLTDNISKLFQYFKDFVLDFWNSFTEKITELFQYFKDFVLDFWFSFTEKLESGFDYLTNKIYNLLLPPRGYIKGWINSYYLKFTNEMGAFGYIHNYIIDLFNIFYTFDYGEPVITFPCMALTVPNYGTYVICEEQEINLNDLVKDIPFAVDTLRFGTSVVMTFWLISYSRKIMNDILK